MSETGWEEYDDPTPVAVNSLALKTESVNSTSNTTTGWEDIDDWGTSAQGSSSDATDWGSSGQSSFGVKRKHDSSKWPDCRDRSGYGSGRRCTEQNNVWSQNRSEPKSNWSSNNNFGSSKKTIQIPSTEVGRIIGRGGSTIQDLQTKSGARIKVNKDGRGYEADIDILGNQQQCDKAEELIQELIGKSDNKRNDDKTRTHNSTFQSSQQSNSWSSSNQNQNDDDFPDWTAIIKESEAATKRKWASLPPLIKEFYTESPEVANMSPEEVATFRKENNNIMVSHFSENDRRAIPNPVTKFEQAFIGYDEILQEIHKQGFENPSPIQAQSWPILLKGYDLIGIAQTGTGKTLAYLLPAMIHIDSQPTPRGQRPGPTAIILAPTRELAQQIEREANKYSYRGIKCICIYGGGDRNAQIDKIEKGVEIVIATPGRLNDLTANKLIDLTSCSYLVLDEADRMLDMGFEPQIRKVLMYIRPNRHSVLMSATWPDGVRRLVTQYMTDPLQIYVGTLDLAATHTVTQKVIVINQEKKREFMYNFIKNMKKEDKVIIFVDRKSLADDLATDCALQNIDVQSIHGDRAQSDREQALDDIRTGYVNILIATDVASRGLDIEDITHILNFDFPRNIEEYVHRVGRTGRAGRTGESITLVTRDDWKHSPELIKILEEADQEVPQELYGMAERYTAWKAKKDAEDALAGGERRLPRFGGRMNKW